MITTTLTVWCDVKPCSQWVYLEAVKRAKANAEIKRRGWKRTTGGEHICPNCQKTKKEAP